MLTVRVVKRTAPEGFTPEQWRAIEARFAEERRRQPAARVLHHLRRILRLVLADVDRELSEEKNSA